MAVARGESSMWLFEKSQVLANFLFSFSGMSCIRLTPERVHVHIRIQTSIGVYQPASLSQDKSILCTV